MSTPIFTLLPVYDRTSGFHPEGVRLLETTCDTIVRGRDKRAANYRFSEFDFENYHSLYMLLDSNGSVVAFEGVYRRSWWPSGVWRVKNRTWIAPEHRALYGHRKRPDWNFVVPRYLSSFLIQRISQEADALFVSMEGATAQRKLALVRDNAAKYWRSSLPWEVWDRYVKVAEGEGPSSWQAIFFANCREEYDLRGEPWLTELAITPAQWQDLYGASRSHAEP